MQVKWKNSFIFILPKIILLFIGKKKYWEIKIYILKYDDIVKKIVHNLKDE